MSKNKVVFKGFSSELFDFLSDLKKNNNTEWFRENRERYDKFVVEPARAYVTEMAPFINRINPAIRTEPKFNKTLMRINKDMRFTKGDPYKNYFLIHFGRFKLDSEFFLYFSPNETDLGIFLNRSEGDGLHFRQNFDKYKEEFLKIFEENKLNNKYSLYEISKHEPKLVLNKFNAQKHHNKLLENEYILFQLNNFDKKKVLTDNLLPLSVKVFTELYPLLCFSYFSDPLKEIEKFKESFGIME